MKSSKQFTVQEWDTLEGQKRARLQEAEARVSILQKERAEALVRSAQGDTGATAQARSIEGNIKLLLEEIESIYALLAVIPERKAYARSFEIEATVQEIQNIDARMPDLAAEIDKAAEAYVLAVKKYGELLKEFLPYKMSFRLDDGPRNAVGFFAKKHSVGYPGFNSRRNDISMSDFIKIAPTFRRAVAARILHMQDHVKRLRGEVDGPSSYCTNCYEVGTAWNSHTGKHVCSGCGKPR